MLPPDAYEMIGKAVAQQFALYDAKFEAMLSRAESVLVRQQADFEQVKFAYSRDADIFEQTISELIERTKASIEAKIETLKDGRDGLDGKDGLNGIDGKDGINGEDGAPGPEGPPGLQGEKGDTGEKGETGPEGQKGDTGQQGDQGLKGDPGIISAEALADAYEGIWTEGEHERGVVVTSGGSLWLCLAKTADKPGEANENWKLIVKRGRDGKDGKNGDVGPAGTPGVKGDKGEIGYA